MWSSGVSAQTTESITSFDVVAEVKANATLKVSEKIFYDFGSNQKHGIYRDILLKNNGYDLNLSHISVVDDLGLGYPFSLSKSGGTERVKIGDPNKTITGKHTYVISYDVSGAIGSFKDFDEVYWNVTGNSWQVPIEHATAKVILPTGAQLTQSACYYGGVGSTNRCDNSQQKTEGGISFEVQNISPREGITVAAGFPKGFVTVPIKTKLIPDWVMRILNQGFIFYIIPVVLFIFMFRKWSRYGRDPKGTGVIIPQYEAPDGLSTMQTRFILKEDFLNTISAEIIQLAVLGFLKIEREPKTWILGSDDYLLTKLKNADETTAPFQVKLLDGLIGNTDGVRRLSSLKNEFYLTVDEIKKSAEESLVSSGYIEEIKTFFRSSSGTRASYKTGAIISALFFGTVLTVLSITMGLENQGTIHAVCASLSSAIIVAVFKLLMPRMTVKGVATKEWIQGFKLYLSVAEQRRIEFHNAPKKDPKVFEKLLPYAMVLGVEKEWAAVFDGIEMTPPSWYQDPSTSSFRSVAFVSAMSSFSTMSNSTLTSSPQSSGGSGGGGFSGGGGGGGGGGSW